MNDRFRITEPLTCGERIADYALGVVLAVLVAGVIFAIVLLAMLGMAR